MEPSGKSIGVFGGTFDPVHNGHLSIAQSFLESDYIDELWIFLSPFPPHKEKNGYASYELRFEMLKAAFKPVENTVVSELESRLSKPSYTIQTIKHLTETYPENSFFLCIGIDSLYSFTSWHRWEEILDYCKLLVADRRVEKKANIPEKLFQHAHFVDHDAVAISSTDIRRRMKDHEPVAHLIPEEVYRIIKRENLYGGT